MQIAIVVAAAENDVIGLDNQLPWHLPDDLRFFKKITLGKPIIMGRNTWESIGKPLPGRLNVVLSSSLDAVPEGVLLFPDWDSAKQFLIREELEEVCIIGGGALYKSTLNYADTVYLTRVHTRIENGTAFFPVLPMENWILLEEQKHEADEKHQYAFTFQKWVKKH